MAASNYVTFQLRSNNRHQPYSLGVFTFDIPNDVRNRNGKAYYKSIEIKHIAFPTSRQNIYNLEISDFFMDLYTIDNTYKTTQNHKGRKILICFDPSNADYIFAKHCDAKIFNNMLQPILNIKLTNPFTGNPMEPEGDFIIELLLEY